MHKNVVAITGLSRGDTHVLLHFCGFVIAMSKAMVQNKQVVMANSMRERLHKNSALPIGTIEKRMFLE